MAEEKFGISDELTDMIRALPECRCGAVGEEIVYVHRGCEIHAGQARPDALVKIDGQLFYNPVE